MTMTWGMWFSTASIITSCCSEGVRTCIRRALPMAGCGMSPSPAISLEVSTTTTRLPMSSARHAGGLAQHRRLADARPTHDQDRLPGLDEVVDDLDRAVDRPADAARQADDLAAAVADGADPVERPLDAGPVVVAERADVLDDEGDVGVGDLALEEHHLRIGEAGLGPTTEVHDDLDQRLAILEPVHGLDDLGRDGCEQGVEVVDRLALAILGSHADLH